MLIILLSLCLGLLNAARGSGVKNMKPVVLLSMSLVAYIITGNYWVTGLFWLPLALSWWIPGGTGLYMPWVVKKLAFLGLTNYTWRFFEFFSVFIYSLIMLFLLK